MTALELLSMSREPMPPWLREYKPGAAFDRAGFTASRIVYYPGHGGDGDAVALFGRAHAAHCFVMADFGISAASVQEQLADLRRGFLGYRPLAITELTEHDLVPAGWRPHAQPAPRRAEDALGELNGRGYGQLTVLVRDEDRGDDHGPARIAIVFLGADGIATYDAMFCQGGAQLPPYAVVLQDHGFGGNYDDFGGGGLMERIANLSDVHPEWLWVAENTKPWAGYVRCDAGPHPGGMYRTPRWLFRRMGPAKE